MTSPGGQRIDHIRVGTGTAEAIEYYPFYLALEGNYFASEGLRVDLTVVPLGPELPELVRSGKVDIGLGGAWRPLMYRGRLDAFVPFFRLVSKCPAALILRRAPDHFDWSVLQNLTVLVPEGAPSPWMFLHGVMRTNGVHPGAVRWIHSLSDQELFALFQAGMGDALLGSWLQGRQLLAQGKAGHVVSLATAGPSVPWSIFYTQPPFLQQTDLLLRFGRALKRAIADVLLHDPIDLKYAGAPYAGDVPEADLDRAVSEFRRNGLWNTDLQIEESSLSMWQDWFVDAGILTSPLPYEQAVDHRIAVQIHKESEP